jgi:hypothetical protein
MDTLLLVCVAVGGTLLLLQLLASLVGLEHADHDSGAVSVSDIHHDNNGFFGILTVRALTSALLFFGLGGLTAGSYGANPMATIAAAVAAGLAALFSVGWLMSQLNRLRADGTVRIENAIGRSGTVYLRIPGERSGRGKVTVTVQNRLVEFQAMTAGPELATGTAIQVVAVINPDTLEVMAS